MNSDEDSDDTDGSLPLRVQFFGDFLTEGVEVLERLANEEEPPIRRVELEKIRNELAKPDCDKKELLKQLGVMKGPFRKRGDVKLWHGNLLEAIDTAFEEIFLPDGEEKIPEWFLHPHSNKYLDESSNYFVAVDRLLAKYSDLAPRYARDWFVYYSIWEVHGYKFPMPLVTSKVAAAVERLAQEFRSGMIEVSLGLVSHIFIGCGYISYVIRFYFTVRRLSILVRMPRIIGVIMRGMSHSF